MRANPEDQPCLILNMQYQDLKYLNEEQLKDLQKLMVAFEQLMKMVGQLMKTLNDTYLATIKNFAR